MSDIRLIQLSNYQRPPLVEVKSKNWVLNGQKNSFYQYIIDRNNGSVTNSAINKAYTDLIIGRGLSARDANLKPLAWAQFISMFSKKDLRNIVSDFQIFGEASIQVVKSKNKQKVSGIYHIPQNLVVPSLENEDGEIEGYWYCKNWNKQTIYPPQFFPVFGTSKEEIEIYKIKPYVAGCNYFANPDYFAGLAYAEMEEEISNFCINSIKNGLSAGYIINIPDGQTLSPEEKEELERKIKEKLTGSPNAQKFILNFGSKDAEITIVPFPVNEQQHKQWDFLTNESRQQIMTAHRVVSPMLFGIKDATGFGNNADELDTAEAQVLKRVIAPKQQYLLDALGDILRFNEINLDLLFLPLTEVKKEPAIQMHSHKSELDSFIDLGEVEDLENYDLIQELEVDYEEEIKLASTGTATPNAKSKQDNKDIIIRYKYAGDPNPKREFCQKMISANKIYRKEDIIAMENRAVNPGWGANGADTYSIWLLKGGGNCHHKWNRVIYLKKGVKIDVNSPTAEIITTSEARRRGYSVEANDTLVSVEPRFMVNNGFLEPRK